MAKPFVNSGDPDQWPRYDLGLHCLPVTPLGISRLQWVNGGVSCLRWSPVPNLEHVWVTRLIRADNLVAANNNNVTNVILNCFHF